MIRSRSIWLSHKTFTQLTDGIIKPFTLVFTRPVLPHARSFSTGNTIFVPPPASIASLEKLKEEKDHAAARKWIHEFELGDIPQDSIEVTYSRSSGPGGQVILPLV